MIMAVSLTVSKTSRGQSLEGQVTMQ